MVTINTDWTDVPHTHKRATIIKMKPVRNARVVHLQRAAIRGSEIFGTFKLAQDASIELHAGKQRIEVECLWFERKPPKTWMHITILCEPIFEDDYTGEVVANIGRLAMTF